MSSIFDIRSSSVGQLLIVPIIIFSLMDSVETTRIITLSLKILTAALLTELPGFITGLLPRT